MKNLDKLNTFAFDTSPSSPHVPEETGDSGLLARVISRFFKTAEYGTLRVTLPNGQTISHLGKYQGPSAQLQFTTWKAILSTAFGSELAFAESYMDGNIETPSLLSVFNWYLANEGCLSSQSFLTMPAKLADWFTHNVMNDNSKRGSKKNISYHYDLGNSFYKAWLDESMTYSSADFSQHKELAAAQSAKYQRIADSLNIKDGDRVLEIGCGWGGFADHVLKNHDISYRGITISSEQLKYAQERLENGKSLFHYQDYRDIDGQFSKIASIEMFEAVGEKHWPTYFETVRNLLAPNGKAALQVITIDHERFLTYRNNVDFIQKYIFPGGMLPSKEAFFDYASAAGLKVENTYNFGKCYAETLRHWKDSFIAAWPELTKQGFDERFYRMWLYYLEYCEAGFDAGSIDVVHFTLTHK